MPVQKRLDPYRGYEDLLGQVTAALPRDELADGDVVVVSESLFAIAQGRLFPLALLYAHDPKTMDEEGRRDVLPLVAEHVPDVTLADLLCADALEDRDPPMATAGVADPNRVAHDLAGRIAAETGCRCDVIVSDTDTALEVREMLIGCITVGATPLGATGGLVLYECMRAANAAEFCRGSTRGIPIVICRPHERRARREGIGAHRGYSGRLDASRERLTGYA
jgi:F420-0:gamma-glutamyl ligase